MIARLVDRALKPPRRAGSPARWRAAQVSRETETRLRFVRRFDLRGDPPDRPGDRAVAVRRASTRSPPACSPPASSPPRSSASPPGRRWPTSSPASCSRSRSRSASATGSTFEDDYGVVEDVRLNYTILRAAGEQRVLIPNEKLASGVLKNDTLKVEAVGVEVDVWIPPAADAARAVEVLSGEGDVAVAETVPWGVRLAVGGGMVTPPERGAGRGRIARALPRAPARGRVAGGFRRPGHEAERLSTLGGSRRPGERPYEPLATLQATPPLPRSSSLPGPSRRHGRADRRRDRRALGRRLGGLDRRVGAGDHHAQGARPRLQHRGARRRRHAPGLHLGRRAEPPGDRRRPAEGAQGRHGRDRGRALLQPPGRRLRGHRPRRGQELPQPRDGRGRLDADHAAGQEPLHRGPHARGPGRLPAQDPRGQAGRGARERALEGVDPREVPQHDAVRDGRRADRDRRRGGRADLLRQARQAARPARGGAAGRPAAGAVGLLADPARPGRQAPPQRGAGQDGRARHGHRAAGAGRDEARARPQAVRLLQPPPRELLLRLRQGRADQGVRPADGQARRPRRAHDDRPRQAAQGARGDRHAARRRRPVVGAGHDQPAQRLHPRDGLVGRLRRLQVQPRRPGRAPARLVVQDDGADDRAAQRRQPEQHALHVASRRRASTTRATARRSRSRPTAARAAAT